MGDQLEDLFRLNGFCSYCEIARREREKELRGTVELIGFSDGTESNYLVPIDGILRCKLRAWLRITRRDNIEDVLERYVCQ